jgi:uncharacterized phage protein (TIGR02218 family)
VDRRDGVVMGFTDFDRDLVFDAVTCKAASGFTATAIQGQLGLAVSNLDVQGALSSDALTEDDLHGGRYDDAGAFADGRRRCKRSVSMLEPYAK